MKHLDKINEALKPYSLECAKYDGRRKSHAGLKSFIVRGGIRCDPSSDGEWRYSPLLAVILTVASVKELTIDMIQTEFKEVLGVDLCQAKRAIDLANAEDAQRGLSRRTFAPIIK